MRLRTLWKFFFISEHSIRWSSQWMVLKRITNRLTNTSIQRTICRFDWAFRRGQFRSPITRSSLAIASAVLPESYFHGYTYYLGLDDRIFVLCMHFDRSHSIAHQE